MEASPEVSEAASTLHYALVAKGRGLYRWLLFLSRQTSRKSALVVADRGVRRRTMRLWRGNAAARTMLLSTLHVARDASRRRIVSQMATAMLMLARNRSIALCTSAPHLGALHTMRAALRSWWRRWRLSLTPLDVLMENAAAACASAALVQTLARATLTWRASMRRDVTRRLLVNVSLEARRPRALARALRVWGVAGNAAARAASATVRGQLRRLEAALLTWRNRAAARRRWKRCAAALTARWRVADLVAAHQQAASIRRHRAAKAQRQAWQYGARVRWAVAREAFAEEAVCALALPPPQPRVRTTPAPVAASAFEPPPGQPGLRCTPGTLPHTPCLAPPPSSPMCTPVGSISSPPPLPLPPRPWCATPAGISGPPQTPPSVGATTPPFSPTCSPCAPLSCDADATAGALRQLIDTARAVAVNKLVARCNAAVDAAAARHGTPASSQQCDMREPE